MLYFSTNLTSRTFDTKFVVESHNNILKFSLYFDDEANKHSLFCLFSWFWKMKEWNLLYAIVVMIVVDHKNINATQYFAIVDRYMNWRLGWVADYMVPISASYFSSISYLELLILLLAEDNTYIIDRSTNYYQQNGLDLFHFLTSYWNLNESNALSASFFHIVIN